MKRPKPLKPPTAKADTDAGKPFDIWLDRSLHEMYDDVASEPIPEELLKLIEDDRPK